MMIDPPKRTGAARGEAVVVGSGPNGLAAAIHLAQAGFRVTIIEASPELGGGARSAELTEPGLVHDVCSAFHPLGAGSPFLSRLPLDRYGLQWSWPDIQLAHPLDNEPGAALWRDLDHTASELGPDAERWRRSVGWVAEHFDMVAADVLRPVLRWPRHPLIFARFGAMAAAPASMAVRGYETESAKALFGGIAAHLFGSLRQPLTASVGLILAAAGHAYGWPVAVGGSKRISDAMLGYLATFDVTVVTATRVASLTELNSADVIMLDTAPAGVVEICGDRLPRRVQRAYRRFRYGPAAFKVDFAIRGHIPWTDPHCRSAGTVHLGGRFDEIDRVERAVVAGDLPARPFVLVGQQYLADQSRSTGELNPIYSYAHVPSRYRGDATEAIIAQIERFAPGFRAQIVSMHCQSPADLEQANPNYVGGDISAGANAMHQLLLRPRVSFCPYSTGIDGVFLCSSSTPPGGGVHAMAGLNAAQAAVAQFEGRHRGAGIIQRGRRRLRPKI